MRHPDARTSARKRLPKSLTAAVAGAAAAAIALPSAISYADPVPSPAPAPAPERSAAPSSRSKMLRVKDTNTVNGIATRSVGARDTRAT
ncbi:hypothetical protein FZI94_25340, partial [Mycobacterium sp. CBMA226]